MINSQIWFLEKLFSILFIIIIIILNHFNNTSIENIERKHYNLWNSKEVIKKESQRILPEYL